MFLSNALNALRSFQTVSAAQLSKKRERLDPTNRKQNLWM